MNIKIKSTGMSCLIGGEYEKIYRALSHKLTGDCEGLFTERVPGNDYLQWNLPGDGWIPLSKSDQATGNEVRRQLNDRLQQVRKMFGKNTETADKVLSVPNDEYVFYKNEPDGRLRIALTAWGYSYPTKVGPNLIDGIGPEPEKKEEVNILVTYNGMPADNEDIKINNTRYTTDTEGRIKLGKMSLPTDLFFEDKNGRKQHVTATPGAGEVTIDVTNHAQVVVKVLLNEQPNPNAQVMMNYCGKQTQLLTDDNGAATTQVIKSRNENDQCEVTINGQTQQAVLDKEVNTFTFNLNEETPPLTLNTPPPLQEPVNIPPLEEPVQTPPPLQEPAQTPPPLPEPPVEPETPPPLEPENVDPPKPEEKPKRTPFILLLLMALLIAALTTGTYFICSEFLHLL